MKCNSGHPMVAEFGGGMDRYYCNSCRESRVTRWYGYEQADTFPLGRELWESMCREVGRDDLILAQDGRYRLARIPLSRSHLWQLFWMLAIGGLFSRIHAPEIPGEDGLSNALMVLAGVCFGGFGWMGYRRWRDGK